MLAGVTVGTDPVQDVIAAGVFVIAFLGYRNGRLAKTNAGKLDAASDTLDQVHVAVNSQSERLDAQATAANERRDVAEAENVQLRADAAQPYDQGDLPGPKGIG